MPEEKKQKGISRSALVSNLATFRCILSRNLSPPPSPPWPSPALRLIKVITDLNKTPVCSELDQFY